MDPDTIWNAIYGQESNSGQNNKTSVTGAVGPGQIQPETFARYAQPGESINNNNDNISVSKRIVQDYYNRFGADPGRIATAYFSGPDNVAPPNSNVPYIQNRTDPTGKKTSSYVSDIQGRLKNMAPDPNFDSNASFGKWEAPVAPTAQNFNPAAAFNQWETSGQSPTAAPSSTQAGSIIPTPREAMTPAQQTAQDQGYKNAQDMPGWWQQNYHPLAAIPETVNAGRAQMGQGIEDMKSGNVATGTGNLAFGAANTLLGPALGPYNETSRVLGNAIGNPQAANVASMVAPTKGILGAMTAALPASRAASGLINLIGKENIPNVLQKLQSNPNLSLMDVSEPVKTVAAGLANSPETPTAQNIMRSAYDARTGARQDVVQKAVDQTLGAPMNVKNVQDQLSQNLKDVGDKLIQPALAGAQPVGVLPIVQRLDSVISSPGITAATKERLSGLRQQLSVNGDDGFIDVNTAHNIQWPLRAEAENLASPMSTGTERNTAGSLFQARNDLVSGIDNAAGGQYKPALAQYRAASAVPDAFERGFNITKTGGIEDFPEYWQAWVKGDPANGVAPASQQEIMAARVGAISKIRQTIEGMQSGARRGEAVLNPTFVQDRFNTIFSPTQTKQLSDLLSDSKNMADTNSLLYKNSKTAQVTAGQNYFQPRQVGTPSGVATGIGAGVLGTMAMAGGALEPGLIGMGIGALKGAHTGMQYLGKLSDKATATNFARLSSASDGPARNELLNILRSNVAGQGNKLSNLSSSLLSLAAP